jgi:phosphate acyltransferase
MIAIDAMGGDYAPDKIVIGALKAARKNIPIMLFGDQLKIESILSENDPSWRQLKISIKNCSEIIEMAEEPSFAVRKKANSSLVKAVESVKQGECCAVISAGNSGALMVAASFILGRLDWVERPAIIAELPFLQNRVVCLDLGANADCKPEYLLQFAYLGDLYARDYLGIERPRIALLSNGQEEGKGNMVTKQAYSLLKTSTLNFIGNIEPEMVFKNGTDVIVSDGFSGNIFLKTLESCEKFFGNKNVSFEKEMGGALLLGVNGIVIVAHGNSDADVMEKAILFAFNRSLNFQKGNLSYGTAKKSNDRMVI